MEIRGAVALVTGANRGLGAAIVNALLDAGVRHVYAAMRHPEDRLIASSRVVPIPLDVTEAKSIRAAAKRCRDVQILINNAGMTARQPLLHAADPGAAEREMRVNYFGTLGMCRAFAPALLANGGGAIVNVLSILSHVNLPRVGSYSASKAAGYSMTQALRAELPRTLVIGVLPAFIDTDMARGIPLPKLSPIEVAASIIEALAEELEDVYPGEAGEIVEQLRADPKRVERHFARLLATTSSTINLP